VAWMKELAFAALELADESLFQGLLDRNDGRQAKELLELLNNPAAAKYSPAIIFYPLQHLVEEEVEELEGKIINYCLTCFIMLFVSAEELIEQLVEQAEQLEEEGPGQDSEPSNQLDQPKKIVKKVNLV